MKSKLEQVEFILGRKLSAYQKQIFDSVINNKIVPVPRRSGKTFPMERLEVFLAMDTLEKSKPQHKHALL